MTRKEALTDLQMRELRNIADTASLSRGEADNLRVARVLENKGLVELVREWTERLPGARRDSTFRAYRMTDSGRALISEADQ